MTTLVALLPTLIPMLVFLWSSGSDGGCVIHKVQETIPETRTKNFDTSLTSIPRQECDELYSTGLKAFYVMGTCVQYLNFGIYNKKSYHTSLKLCKQFVADYSDYEGELVSNDFPDEKWRMIPGLSVRSETVKFFTNEGPTEEDRDLCATIHLMDDGSNENYTDFTIIRDQIDPCKGLTGLDNLCIISN